MAQIAYARQRTPSVGNGQAILFLNPQQVVAKRAPTSADKKEVGTFWFYPTDTSNNTVGNAYVNVLARGSWQQLVFQGGSGNFSSLNVTNDITAGGFIDAGTTIDALGNITTSLGNLRALNGNLVLASAGNRITIGVGANASIGTSAAMVAGTVTVNTNVVTASSLIFVSRNTPGGTTGNLSVPSGSIVPGVSFAINSSSATETSTINWWIIN